MIIADFIKELKAKGINLRNDNGVLRFTAPQGALTEDLQAKIKAGKPEILAWFEAHTDAPQICHDESQRHAAFTLSPIQQAYLIGRDPAFELGGNAAHAYTELETVGLDTAQFMRAWQATIAAHDALRTQFNRDNTQYVLQDIPSLPFQEIDLRDASGDEVERKLAALRQDRAYRSSDVYAWPQYDIVVVHLPEDRYRVSISFDLMVADAFSGELMLAELIARYHEITPYTPSLTFRDVSVATESLHAEQQAQDRSYWSERVNTIAPPPELPQINGFDNVQFPKYERFDFSITPDLYAQLSERARQRGVTANAVLLTAFSEVLSRWSAGEDVSVGVTLFNRPAWHPDINRIIGEFTNTTLASYEAAVPKFIDRVKHVQGSLWDGINHSALSGVDLLRMLPKRRPGQAVLPYIFTSLLDVPMESDPLATIPQGKRQKFDEVFAISQTPQVAIDHQIYMRDGKVRFIWDVVSGVFPDGMIATMQAAYHGLLLQLADDDAPWDHMSPIEQDASALAIRNQLNDTAAPISDACLSDGFWCHVEAQPDAVAVIDATSSFTYAELGRWVRRVAGLLRAQGVQRGDRVAIACPKGAEQIASVLAVHFCGAAYVPLSWDNPVERNRKILEDCAAQVLIVSQSSPLHGQGIDMPIVQVDREQSMAGEHDATPPVYTAPDDLAYIIFTSGSTGRPKGVALSHRAALNTILDVNGQHSIQPTDRFYGISSLSFDLSVYDVFGALTAGATLVLPSEHARKDPEQWTRDVQKYGITIWNSAPALAELLAERSSSNGLDISSLRAVLLSGDWIPLTLTAQLKSVAPMARVMGMGGATEAAIWTTCSEISLPLDPNWTSVPYGAPMVNQSYYVLDERLQQRPDWVVGDLYLGGIGLAQQYWGDPEKTAAAFMTHDDIGQRLYRTGDRARFWPDGRLEFLGRDDTQVKIGGHRIELGEIMAALSGAQGVASAAVQVVPLNNVPYLVAVVATKGATVANADTLSSHLSQRVPAYMVPHHFVILDDLPLSANGKVDQAALRQICADSLSQTITQVAPRNAFEELLTEIWADVLDLETIGVTEDFFTIGGDSLKALRLSNRIQAEFNLDLTIGQFLTSPTIEKQAALVVSIMETEIASEDLEVFH